MKVHIGNLVETDEVDAAVESFEQSDEFAGMRGGVVDTAKHDVFERESALVGEVVIPQEFHHILDGHRPIGRHEHRTLLADGRVEADGHMTLALLDEPLQFPFHTHRTDGDASGAPSESPIGREDLCGAQHSIEVVHRLTLSHEHDVGQPVALGKRVYLVEDVACREVSLESLLSRLAEQTIHLASHLARYA